MKNNRKCSAKRSAVNTMAFRDNAMPPPLKATTETISLWSFINDPIGFLSDGEHAGTHLILTLDGTPMGAIVPVRDLQKLEDNNP